MQENPIASRIFEFLRKYPPYHQVKTTQLLEICRSSELTYYHPGDVVFKAGESISNKVFVVYKGMIHLKWPDSQEVFESAEPGDTFGIRAAFSGNPYVLTAEAAEESLILSLNLELFRQLMKSDAKFSSYFASGLASGTMLRHHQWEQLSKAGNNLIDDALKLENFFDHERKPITSSQAVSIPELAKLMIQHQVGSVVITNDGGRPIGIVTDKDLRKLIAAGQDPCQLKSADIMSGPVITIDKRSSWSDAYLTMAEHSIRHLVITDDGTPHTVVKGVISEHDLLRNTSMQMLSTLKKIKSAPNVETLAEWRSDAELKLRKFLDQEINMDNILPLANKVNDLTTCRAIELALSQLGEETASLTPENWCWMALGSLGRREQVLRTDQDNALLYLGSEHFRELLIKFATIVNDILETCGYEKCPALVMASNPQWCLTLDEWKRTFEKWIRQPEPKAVMYTTIFFDFRPVYGNYPIAIELKNYILELIEKNQKFLSYLAANALSAPPAFTLFKSLATEDSGEHKGMFDLKGRALAPYADIARILAYQHKIAAINDTAGRFETIAKLEPHYAELLQDAAKAFKWLLKIRWKNANGNHTGRYLSKSFLSPLDRQILKKALMPLQVLQSIIETRFQTQLLR
ncbi:DUF294 nucleotidyltransferase-like domain-containing protein [Schleiferia thermophila]